MTNFKNICKKHTHTPREFYHLFLFLSVSFWLFWITHFRFITNIHLVCVCVCFLAFGLSSDNTMLLGMFKQMQYHVIDLQCTYVPHNQHYFMYCEQKIHFSSDIHMNIGFNSIGIGLDVHTTFHRYQMNISYVDMIKWSIVISLQICRSFSL